MSANAAMRDLDPPSGSLRRGSILAAARLLWRELTVVAVYSLITNLLMLSPTLYMMQIYDRIMPGRNELTLLFISAFVLVLFLMIAFCEWSRSKLIIWGGMRFDALLGDAIFAASHRQALAGELKNPGAALTELTKLRQFVTGLGIFAFFDLPWTPVYVAVLFLLHPLLGWTAVFFILNLCFLLWLSHRLTTRPAQLAADTERESANYVQSHLRAAETVESMGLRRAFLAIWQGRNAAATEALQRASELESRMKGVTHLVRTFQQSLMLGVGALLVIEGHLNISAMIAANVLLTRASAPLDMMVGAWKGTVQALKAIGFLDELLATPNRRATAGSHAGALGGEMVLEEVDASVPGRSGPILSNINVTLKPGELVALVGPSGSGKSTLMKILAGIWNAHGGKVSLDGIPLQQWERTALGKQLGYLPQEVDLYIGSFAENIARFGEVDPQAVIEAAQRANVHELLLRFPRGYDTPVMEGGTNLSAGQRQRLGLARALYGSPNLLLLDEPNANLDEAGEKALQAALLELRNKQATVVVASHRPSVLTVADRVLVLEAGKLVYDGPPSAMPGPAAGRGALSVV